MGSSQQFSLRWNNYLKHITCAFETLRSDEDLVDVTLSCEGKKIRAHKMLLSACSTYFRDLFKENPCQHPIIIFRNVKFDDLAALVDFMYQGEVNVIQEQLASFLTTAELLAVQGLTDGTGKDDSLVEDDIEIPNEPEVQLQNTSGKSMGDNKRNKSPSSPMPYHAVELQPEVPPNKRRKIRENMNVNAEKNSAGINAKDSEKTAENQTGPGSDPVEIIPLMPNLKLEMPEYLEQDGSSCSYEDQSIGDNALNKITIDDTSSTTPDHEQKVDISQTFYTSQSASDSLDSKHQSDVGHLLSKPSTSGERATQDAVQDSHTVVIEQPSHSCKLCGKSFWNRDSMYKHMNMHKGTTQCPVCHKVLSRTTHMKRHLRNRHGWLGTTASVAAGGVEAPISVSSTAQTIAQQDAGSPSSIDANATYTTIRIRESSVERITSSPIP
ncbi:PREDICTED: protein tramtrack, beta isoform-like [Atta cephalotes]|uniref:BTB domain-containing protein n=1 Tax=Atta cephalotes TaxID=12957 RepID=A0A158NI44_ATTCE|nr:PREDICTED: protein tramtrack, beta isoform-like [Atta cephalotes]XP_018052050.1 PREDICTED: protein tramtrack, beta isoform-like isoform X1 [Atta colombica]